MSAAHPSSFTLDLHALEALPADQVATLRAHLAECGRCQALVDRDEGERRRFSAEVFPRRVALLRARRRRAWLVLVAPALAIAAVALLWARPRPPEVALKGGPALFAYARHEGRISAVRDGAALHPGDEVRFAVLPGEYGQVMVASIDSAGRASVYFPFDGAASGEIAGGGRAELPGSVVLDGTLGPERLFALFSRRPLPSRAVAEALRRVGQGGPEAIRRTRSLPVAAEAQDTLLIEKPQ
jgi:hypothetical protein